ncbi:MAG TPA: YueI family protein [Peptococcaceae bacterium]|nr:YueI family protein [Peptococcaceae bacterium]
MDKDLQKDAIKEFANKTELERTIAVGIHGPPELKAEEKNHHLGEFRERILIALTKAQVMNNKIYPEIEETLNDRRAAKMLINGDIAYKYRGKYQKLAAQKGKSYTVVHDPNLEGNIGLIIVSDRAVDKENIFVTD